MTRTHRRHLVFALALLAALGLFAGRWFLGSVSDFSRWDDEGFVMIMLRQYLAGDRLYSESYAQYGPFAYQALAAMHRGLGLIPTNDSARISSVIVYSTTFCVWSGLAAYHLRNPAVVILFLLGLGQQLITTTAEPGHPQDVGALLIAICVATTLAYRTASSATARRFAAMLCGVAVGALLLTKLNLGVFVIAALLFLAPIDRFGWRYGRFAIALVPLILMQQRLGQQWVSSFCLIETVGFLLFLVATRDMKGTIEHTAIPWLAGVLASLSAILGVELWHGVTPSALADGVIFQHLNFTTQAMQEGFVPPETRYAVVISITLFLVLHLNRQREWSVRVTEALRLIGAAAGLAYAIGFGVDYLFAFGLPFVWLSLSRRVEPGWMLFIAALALLLPLQAYPVAGSQVYLGAVPLTFLCALMFSEVANESDSRVIRTALMLLAAIGLIYQLGALRKGYTEYAALTPLALPGASLVRLPADEANGYQRLTQRMKQFDAFVTQPGLLSLYLWTEVPPPTKWNAGAWVRLISPQHQSETVTALRGAERPGAAAHTKHAVFWTEGKQEVSAPLAAYIDNSCTTVETIGEWQVRTCERTANLP